MKHKKTYTKKVKVGLVSSAVCVMIVLSSPASAWDLFGSGSDTKATTSATTSSGSGTDTSSVTGAVGGASGAISSFQSGDIGGAVKGVGSMLGISGLSSLGISSSMDDMLKGIGKMTDGIDKIFGKFDPSSIFSSISGDNHLMGCLAKNIDIGKLLGGASGKMDGLCSMLDIKSKLGDSAFGGTTGCLLGSMGDSFKGLDSLSSICNGSGSGSGNGNGTGNGTGTGTGTGNGNGTTPSSTKELDALAVVISDVELEGVGGEAKKVKPKKDRKYKSGLSYEEIRKKDGGLIAKNAKANPSSAEGRMWQTLNVEDQELTDLAHRLISKTATAEDVRLPATPADGDDKEDAVAKIVNELSPDFGVLQDSIAIRVKTKYTTLKANNLIDYYKREKHTFDEFVKNDKELATLKEKAYKAIETKYGQRLFKLKTSKGYLSDTSESRAKEIPLSKRNLFRWNAMQVMNSRAMIKADMAKEKKEFDEALNRTVARAYPISSIFRADICNKEIDEMLKAIDTAIK